MRDMLVIVPSRGRPDNAIRLLKAWQYTHAAADLLLLVDEDDPTVAEYETLILSNWGTIGRVDGEVGERRRIGPLVNLHAVAHADEYRVIGFMGDDHVPRTDHWDELILAASTPWSVVYGDDLFQGPQLPTAVFMGTGLIKALGFMHPPELEHLYLDNAWKLLGLSLGTLQYLPGVVIEHMHPAAGKADMDPSYEATNSRLQYETDGRAYQRWVRGPIDDDIDRVVDAMEATA